MEAASETRAVELIQLVQNLLPAGQDALPVLTLEELQRSQELDPTISSIMRFVIRKRRPSRRDRAKLDGKAMVLIKQWERLRVHSGILYRIIKDHMSKQWRHQYVLPELSERESVTWHS